MGCSSGGKQGLREAQKFPADYDGIVAGAPANYWTHLVTQSVWVAAGDAQGSGELHPSRKYAVRAPAGRSFRASRSEAERGWAALAGGPRPLSIAEDHFKYVVFKNPDWDFKTLDFDRDLDLADRIDRDFELNANDPNLQAFATRVGKILMCTAGTIS